MAEQKPKQQPNKSNKNNPKQPNRKNYIIQTNICVFHENSPPLLNKTPITVLNAA